MNIAEIELINFRNYNKFKINDLDNKNIIIGNNGIGKTSILEAIYVCSLARSFKNTFDNNLINSNKNYLKIKISLEGENKKKKKLEYLLSENGKKTKINNNLKKRISDFIFQYKIVLFSPDELKIIKEAPSVRRNYINISLSQINKTYIKTLNKYNVLIKNKNEYLKRMYLNRNLDPMYLNVLDEKIIDLGLEIYECRKNYIEKVNKYIQKIFRNFKNNDTLQIKYVSQFENKTKKDLVKLFKKYREKEIVLGVSKIGIQKDDLEFLHNDKNAKDFSSQGTQKLIILAFKLAELEILKKEYYEEPILLLDDLFSELDIENQNKIIKFLKNDIQIFITTTDINNVNKKIIKNAKIINLNEEVKE